MISISQHFKLPCTGLSKLISMFLTCTVVHIVVPAWSDLPLLRASFGVAKFWHSGSCRSTEIKNNCKKSASGWISRVFWSWLSVPVCLELQPLGQRNESKLQTLGLGVWKASGYQRAAKQKRRERSKRTSGFLDTRWATFCLVRSVPGRDTSFMSFDFSQHRGLHSYGSGFHCLSRCGIGLKGTASCNLDFLICHCCWQDGINFQELIITVPGQRFKKTPRDYTIIIF